MVQGRWQQSSEQRSDFISKSGIYISSFSNHGAILVDEQTGVIKTNNTSSGSFIVNHTKELLRDIT